MKTKKFVVAVVGAMLALSAYARKNGSEESQTIKSEPVVVAYVSSWSNVIPDPSLMTHLNYAFGHVSEGFDSVRISNPGRLRELMALKKKNPDLNILLSVGGWGSGRFSEMAANDSLRHSFAADCRRVVDDLGLDGIDIDWEYPTSNAAGISSSLDDTANFNLLMADIRNALGTNKLLTLATFAGADYIDFKGILDNVDLVNVMSYDMACVPKHHSPLCQSESTGDLTVKSAVYSHLAAGVPAEKLVVGLPFYGRGTQPYSDFVNFRDLEVKNGIVEEWDSVARAPYMANSETGEMVLGFDNPQSLILKLNFIKYNGLRGAMYWDYAGDDDNATLAKLVANEILKP